MPNNGTTMVAKTGNPMLIGNKETRKTGKMARNIHTTKKAKAHGLPIIMEKTKKRKVAGSNS